jgi:hypothetical protein
MPVVSNCRECFARPECGGWTPPDEGEPLISCFEAFGNGKGLFIDPNRRKDFLQRLAEVRYFAPAHPGKFNTAELAGFPDYVTLVQGGVCFHRPLALDHAALNLVEIFHGDKACGLSFGRRSLTAESLRAEWGLDPGTHLILSGVAGDPQLERLWANHRAVDIAGQVAKLRVVAVTAPNFTFWQNAPRLENMVNRLRMFRVAEALSTAGVAVIPHLNSSHPRDWEWNYEFFSEHRELMAVCMEFRTGNRVKEVRQQKVIELARLRDRLGRELLPVVIGNTEAAREMRTHFPQVLAIDSMPALKTVRRQRAIQSVGLGLGWRTEPLGSGVCMADLYEANFNAHHSYVMARLARPMETQEDNGASAALRRTSRAASRLLQGELPLAAA